MIPYIPQRQKRERQYYRCNGENHREIKRGVAEDLPRIEVITLHYNAARDNNNIIERD